MGPNSYNEIKGFFKKEICHTFCIRSNCRKAEITQFTRKEPRVHCFDFAGWAKRILSLEYFSAKRVWAATWGILLHVKSASCGISSLKTFTMARIGFMGWTIYTLTLNHVERAVRLIAAAWGFPAKLLSFRFVGTFTGAFVSCCIFVCSCVHWFGVSGQAHLPEKPLGGPLFSLSWKKKKHRKLGSSWTTWPKCVNTTDCHQDSHVLALKGKTVGEVVWPEEAFSTSGTQLLSPSWRNSARSKHACSDNGF